MPNFKSKKMEVARRMPPSYHKLPSEKMDIEKSEVVKWLIHQRDILSFLWINALKSGHIKIGPENGMYVGVDYDMDKYFETEDKKGEQRELANHDSTVTEFFMPMIPPTTTHQQKQVHVINGKPVFYEPDDLKAARSKLMAHLGQHVPDEKYKKAIRLTSWWCFKRTGKHQDGTYKTTKPDTDNLVKTLKDCMTALGYWEDDALVASEVIEKYWADMPGIYIKIEEVYDP